MARSFEGPITTAEPVPVSTNMMPPVPMGSRGEVMQGGVTQMRVAASTQMDHARATVSSWTPQTMLQKEVGQAVYVTGPSTEEDAAPQVTVMNTEQLMMGELQQQVVEIPQITYEEIIQEVPEVMIVKKIQEASG